jgi:hypothetical protein
MKDMLSNELNVGDCVMVKYGTEWVSGVIAKLQNGGLILGVANPTQKNGAPQQTADVVVLQMTIPLAGQPGQPQPFIVRLDTKARTEAIVESAIKM